MTLLLLVSGGWRPSARWRDAPDASIRLTSFNIEGLMCGIKVPQQDFVLKMPGGGLMRRGGGGVFAGNYGISSVRQDTLSRYKKPDSCPLVVYQFNHH